MAWKRGSKTKNDRSPGLWTWLSVAVIIGGAIAIYDQIIDPYLLFDRWGEVEPGLLYRSGDPPAYAVQGRLDEMGIQKVIKLSHHVDTILHHRKSREACEALGAELVNVPMGGDGIGTVETYTQALVEIHESVSRSQPVLVHCAAGTNRTGGVIASYRIFFDGWDGQQAYHEMTKYNFDTEKNPHLLPWLNQTLPAIGQQLVDRGLIDRLPDPLPVVGPESITRPATEETLTIGAAG
jgi:hypothetical protein